MVSTTLFVAVLCTMCAPTRGQLGLGLNNPHGHVEIGKPRLSEDAGHIMEHLKDTVDIDTTKLTASELEFHYFKLHDFDQNNKLDGLEMLQALMHSAYEGSPPAELPTEPIDITLYTDLIDKVLKDDDLDNDGCLSYEEYKHRVDATI